MVRVLAVLDVALANTITRSDQQVRFNVSDDVAAGSELDGGLRIAPKLARVSFRSTLAVLYFATVKFALGVISIVSVSIPWLPIVSEMLADYASDTANSMVAGFSPKKFNFGTNPVLYLLTCIGYFIVGVICMHVFGRLSRGTTRQGARWSLVDYVFGSKALWSSPSDYQQVRFNVPDDVAAGSELDGGLRIAPKLARVSFRSTLAVLYFATVKFALGVISIVSVSIPWLPIVSELLFIYEIDTDYMLVAEYTPEEFNFWTDPMLYTLACIGYFVVGVIGMHVFGRLSRGTTRRVLTKEFWV
ncbi:hypothetical protein P43SY_008180 [Pythium insidiosum]|uniref:Uncharacterized protein n=1 Tax=Pythium insidiosum TaxID=114742 RepID=A0AAD5LF90_PYTIN|nr:hypothetical protein P43SY_008180 [Pythium insidiosum]